MGINGTQQIPWPEWSVYRQDEAIGEALYNATSAGFALRDTDHNAELATMATTNGLIGDEPQRVLHNATIAAISTLQAPYIAKLRPEHIEPLILASVRATNSVALQSPLKVLRERTPSGYKQMATIGETRSQLYQARHQDSSPIQDAPGEILRLGLDKQPFQPFAFVFVGKERQSDPFDQLLRFQNPFATTVMGAVSNALREALMESPKQAAPQKKPWSLGDWLK